MRELRVLIALDSPLGAEPILEGLPDRGLVVSETTLAEGLALVGLEPFDLVLSTWNGRWRRWLVRNAPTPHFVHLGPVLPEILSASASGLLVHACADAAELRRLVQRVAGPARSAARLSPGVDARVTKAGADLGLLTDFSNSGLSVAIPFGRQLDGLAGNHLLDDVEIVVGAQRVLGPVQVRVVRLETSTDGYVAGLVFVREPLPSPLPRRTVTDSTRIAALLLAGAERGGVVLKSHEAPIVGTRLQGGAIEGDHFVVAGASVALPPLSLVDVEFEVAGAQCAFTTLLLEASPVRLRVPRALQAFERRVSERRPVSPPGMLNVTHPLLGTRHRFSVRDLSLEGVGLEVPPDGPSLPPGLELRGCTLELGPAAFIVHAVVRRTAPNGDGAWRIGVKLRFEQSGDAGAFARAWLALEFPGLEVVSGVEAAELMRFFVETKAAPDQVDVPFATSVLERLQHAPSQLHWSIVARRAGQIAAAASGIRRYPRTWTLQHLSMAGHDLALGRTMLRILAEMVLQDPTADFLHANYSKSNAWSARFLGAGVAGFEDPGRGDIATRDFLVFRGAPQVEVGAVTVHAPVGTEARIAAEALIAQHESVVAIQAHGWQAHDWALPGLGQGWRAAGLQRERHVFGAYEAGSLLGFSIAELSTPTMNFREDLSAARVWLAPGLQGPRRVAALGALLTALGSFYSHAGRAAWPLIASREEEDRWVDALAVLQPVRFVEVVLRRDAAHALSQVWALADDHP